jgi:hypothetical protein
MHSLGIEFGAQFPLIESIEIQVKNWTFIFERKEKAGPVLKVLKGASSHRRRTGSREGLDRFRLG